MLNRRLLWPFVTVVRVIAVCCWESVKFLHKAQSSLISKVPLNSHRAYHRRDYLFSSYFPPIGINPQSRIQLTVRIIDAREVTQSCARSAVSVMEKWRHHVIHHRVAGVKLLLRARQRRGEAKRRLPGSKVARERLMRVIEDPISRSVGGLKSWYMVRANERDNIDTLSERGSSSSPAITRLPAFRKELHAPAIGQVSIVRFLINFRFAARFPAPVGSGATWENIARYVAEWCKICTGTKVPAARSTGVPRNIFNKSPSRSRSAPRPRAASSVGNRGDSSPRSSDRLFSRDRCASAVLEAG